MWAKARAVGNAPALSTGRAGARQRIVHMSTAWAVLAGAGVLWVGGGCGLWPLLCCAACSVWGGRRLYVCSATCH
jgi:hypothetical protein